jgi:tRNA-dihydrouridine synthase B
MCIQIGNLKVRNNVFLAPMSGVTDAAFRKIAHAWGAGLVVSEMVASEELAKSRKDMVRRALGQKTIQPFVIQLAGREAKWMAVGAKLAADMGADIIDINMGCPARQVTGGLSGSALMRDPDHALTLVAATVQATSLPVTLKMRLGWDHSSINAPDIAKRAEDVGIKMITVHGRTRCMFYKGRADWPAIRTVRDAINIPLIANGDGDTAADARRMMEVSGANAVMFGRSAYGRPWWPGTIANALNAETGRAAPTLSEESEILQWHQQETLSLYGESLGNKTFRKHFGWAIDRLAERSLLETQEVCHFRSKYLPQTDNGKVTNGIKYAYALALDRRELKAA